MPVGIAKSPTKPLRGSQRAQMLVRRARELHSEQVCEQAPSAKITTPVVTPDKPISKSNTPPAMKRRPLHAARLFN
tara:strand:+ start:693 stop:920 length:228 start_codon:yes stop_codon:yes gene_type:complete